MRYVARLARHTLTAEDENYRWEVAEQGRLESLRRVPQPRRKPASGEIEIELHAAGLNFRDVLTALDLYPGNPGAMGLEGAGTVVAIGAGVDHFAVGDRVMAIAPGCFSRYLTVDARLAVRIPDGLSDVEAATIPSVFVTAWHCLQQLAGIKKGDCVLIHTATGGIGHAAIQIAQLADAEVYATASPTKWSVLKALGVSHIYNSRTLGFGQAILAGTNGRGVDIVLNTLTAPGFISESAAALASGGCFLEISKRDVFSVAQMAAVRPDARYRLIDQAEILIRESNLVQEQLRLLADLFVQGKLTPIPRTVFPMGDMASAFRMMERATHIGKLVLAHPRPRAVKLDASATYLITGGLGGLGLVIARGLVERGARRLLLVSRNAPAGEAQRKLEEMRQMGATVATAQADMSDAARVAELIAAIPPELPLKGVIHAAGLLDDGLLVNQSPERFARVMAPKVDGAWNLHRLTESLPLDFFVLFSSASSLLGLAGQANYAAANSFLDALAHHRKAVGLPALAINWGVWAEVGSAAQFVPQLKRMGLEAIQPRQGPEILDALLSEAEPQIGVIPINWNRFDTRRVFVSGFRQAAAPATQQDTGELLLPALRDKSTAEKKALLASHIQGQVARILRYGSPAAVPMRQGFRELGLDSLTSMELRNRLQSALECQLPAAVIFNHPNVDALATYLVDAVLTGTPAMESAASTERANNSAGMRERMLSVNGLQLCLCEWGPEGGTPVVCVHGTRDHGASWEGVAAVLEAEGCHVVAPDLRGHGRSDHGGPSSQYQLTGLAGDLAEIVNQLGKRPVTLVGHSLGSIVAVLYAAAFPERVGKLLLVEPTLSPMAEDAQSFAQQMAAHLRAGAGIRQHALMPDLRAAAERLRQLTPALSTEVALRRAERLTVPQAGGVVWRWDARFDGQAQLDALFASLRQTEFLAMLGKIRAPLTVVYGGNSGWISPAEKARIQSACPNLQTVVVAGGHNVHLDAATALAEVVRQTSEVYQEGAAACQ
jgi:NADPH:quinone reductase-like Zn-dependent oxidoreductase/pimeloyl-ACP methyl ester carboxylesterase/NAD(P)-dependent dehydrogenase (short-subunit alcohol dehydrogenase family)/acyl carrier protein